MHQSRPRAGTSKGRAGLDDGAGLYQSIASGCRGVGNDIRSRERHLSQPLQSGHHLRQRAPHFVEYVRQQLEERYGPEVVYKGGLNVYTTLDPKIQTIVEQEATKQIAALQAKNVHSAAAVAVNPKNGEIYAMLGSVDFNDASIDGQVNVATRLRQPGSSIKPLNYLAAFEKGWTPATPIYDLVTSFPNGAQPPYIPKNYDDKEHGLVRPHCARQFLQHSRGQDPVFCRRARNDGYRPALWHYQFYDPVCTACP